MAAGITLRPTSAYPEKDKKVIVTYKFNADGLRDYIVESALDDLDLDGDSDTSIFDEHGNKIELKEFEKDALEDLFYDNDLFKKLEFDNDGNAYVTFEGTIEADVYKEENESDY